MYCYALRADEIFFYNSYERYYYFDDGLTVDEAYDI